MKSSAKCFHCRDYAVWAMQFLGDTTEYGFYIPTFSLLGNHYRGIKVFKVCDDCKAGFQTYRLIFKDQKVTESPF